MDGFCFFLKEASGLSSQKYVTRKALEGQRVSRFMTPCPVSIAWYKSLAGFGENTCINIITGFFRLWMAATA